MESDSMAAQMVWFWIVRFNDVATWSRNWRQLSLFWSVKVESLFLSYIFSACNIRQTSDDIPNYWEIRKININKTKYLKISCEYTNCYNYINIISSCKPIATFRTWLLCGKLFKIQKTYSLLNTNEQGVRLLIWFLTESYVVIDVTIEYGNKEDAIST